MFNNCHLKGQRCGTAKVAAFEMKMKLLKPELASAECRERMLQETRGALHIKSMRVFFFHGGGANSF